MIVVGFFLGIGGTAFAVGVPHVSAWYPPARRGFAIGVFGIGMGGTAISNFTTVKLTQNYGLKTPVPARRRDAGGLRGGGAPVAARRARAHAVAGAAACGAPLPSPG